MDFYVAGSVNGDPWNDIVNITLYGNWSAFSLIGIGDPQGPGGNTSGGASGQKKDCFGEARVIGAGAPGIGAFKQPNDPGTLAIIPTQFTGSNSTTLSAYNRATGALRPYINQISVGIANPNTGVPLANFGPITDVIGPRSAAAKLMNANPGELILEVNGVPESGLKHLPVVVTVPKDLPCPTGTKEIK